MKPCNNIAITPELIAQHGLKNDEYQHILTLIGREPTFTELGIFLRCGTNIVPINHLKNG